MEIAQRASDEALNLQKNATGHIVFGAALSARDAFEAADSHLPLWAIVAAALPQVGWAVPGGEALGSCAAAIVLAWKGYP